MAPVLLCPECGTKHPLDDITSATSFPCSGCGRTLKVPAQAREMTASAVGAPPVAAPVAPPPAPAPAPVLPAAPLPPVVPAPHATQAVAAVPPVAVAAASVPTGPPLGQPQGIPSADLAREPARPAPTGTTASAPPVWMRLLLWLIAVPLAFLVVFGFARAFGFLATNDITDIALADGFHRYWPIIRLLPFVALVTAVFVTAGVYGLARMRGNSQTPTGSSSSGTGARPKSRRPPSRQSSRAGA